MKSFYRHDLASIHDGGFGVLARAAASELLARLTPMPQSRQLIVELGCGSGILSERLAASDYRVLGVDLSESLLALARSRVPTGEIRLASCYDVAIPPCTAVAAIGEVLCYRFDRRASVATLQRLFRRVFQSLLPGGLFLFDMAAPGRVIGGRNRSFVATEDWACLVEATEMADRRTLERRITTFRRVDASANFRRDEEIHQLRLYEPPVIVDALRHMGFRVRTLKGYDDFQFSPGWCGFLARKPAR